MLTVGMGCYRKLVWRQGGFPGGSAAKNSPAMQEMQETQAPSLGQEDLLEEGMATHFSILAWRIQGWRSLAGYSPWGQKELDRTEASEHAHAWRCGRGLIAGAGDKQNGIGKGRVSLSGDFGRV